MRISGRDFGDYLRAVPERIEQDLYAAEVENSEAALRIAREQSDGPISAKELAQMGHPFARRAPQSPPPAEVLNRQSGEAYRGWYVEGPFLGRTAIYFRINNRVHYRRFWAGTRTTIPRPVAAAIVRRLAPERRRRLIQALYYSFQRGW